MDRELITFYAVTETLSYVDNGSKTIWYIIALVDHDCDSYLTKNPFIKKAEELFTIFQKDIYKIWEPIDKELEKPRDKISRNCKTAKELEEVKKELLKSYGSFMKSGHS